MVKWPIATLQRTPDTTAEHCCSSQFDSEQMRATMSLLHPSSTDDELTRAFTCSTDTTHGVIVVLHVFRHQRLWCHHGMFISRVLTKFMVSSTLAMRFATGDVQAMSTHIQISPRLCTRLSDGTLQSGCTIGTEAPPAISCRLRSDHPENNNIVRRPNLRTLWTSRME